MWGYSSGFDAFQHPGPVLCVHEGDKVTVILHNTLPEATSIVFPGQDDVRADGAPSQPQVDGTGMMTSLAPGAAATSGSVTYTFTANRAGTYLYEAGTNPEKQVRMGLFGALIVRPVDSGGAAHDDYAYDSSDSHFTASEEFMVLLSEIDPYQHQAVETNKPFNLANYKPRYWLINGRGYPDSIADNGASWLPSQPYGSLATVKPYDATNHPLPGHGPLPQRRQRGLPLPPARQQRHWSSAVTATSWTNAGHDLSMEKFAINIGPGQTWDVLFKWFDAEDYSPANPVHRHGTVPSLANQVVGTFYSGSPYLGKSQALPAGSADAQPVRRVLHHQPQPRAVPDHLVGSSHDRPDHVHADRTARAQHLRLREAAMTMKAAPAHCGPVDRGRRRPDACSACSSGPAPPARTRWAIDLDATTGTTMLPGRATAVPVWGYCQRSAPPTPCGNVSAPGGPTLVVTAGDVVTITLHNRLTEASSLQVGGQAARPRHHRRAGRRHQGLHVHREPTRDLPLPGRPHAEQPAPGGHGPVRRPRRQARHGGAGVRRLDRLRHRVGARPRRGRPRPQRRREPRVVRHAQLQAALVAHQRQGPPEHRPGHRRPRARRCCCAGSTRVPPTTRWVCSARTSASSRSTATS